MPSVHEGLIPEQTDQGDQGEARPPGRRRRLAYCLAVLVPSLTSCGTAAGADSTSALWGAGCIVLVGGTAFAVREATERPLRRARDRAVQNLAAANETKATLLAERHELLTARSELIQHQNELARQGAEVAERLADVEGTFAELTAERDALVLEREQLQRICEELERERDELEGSVDATFVNLAMRTLSLVERQLILIESLEAREGDPAQLESLFRLDHMATRMRRNSENMLLLAGMENSQRIGKTVTLLDVVRAAVSEIERYERVKLGFLASVRLNGAAADDTSHLLAELLENATAFSPPQDQVEVSGWLLDNGEVMISVTDRGIGVPTDRMRALNEQLAEQVEPGSDRREALLSGAMSGRSMGLFVVARLARRHDIRVQLRENAQGGGVTAMVVLPNHALEQDTVDTADLDEQRRAERNAASVADHNRAGAETAAPARPTAADRAARARAAADEPLPELPRRRPGESATAAGTAQAEAADEQQTPAHGTTAPESAAAIAAALPHPVDGEPQVELPRRVSRGNGLPGTGESPTSGLRRIAGPTERPLGRPVAAADDRTGVDVPSAAGPRTGGMSPEELRRRLGGFQSGLRDAGKRSAVGARTGNQQPAVGSDLADQSERVGTARSLERTEPEDRAPEVRGSTDVGRIDD